MEILESIDRITPLTRSYIQAKGHLRGLQEKLLVYLGGQTIEMFNYLTESFQSDRETGKKIEFLVHDLKDMKVKALLFFDEFPADLYDVNPKNFPKKFSDFAGDVLARFHMEETYLFPLFEKLQKDA